MERSTIISGFGGQGILFTGRVLAEAALREGREVLWIPSYGPEMRGGTASCTVIVADRPVGSPVVDRADQVVVLNPPSLARYGAAIVPGGLLVVNSTLCGDAPARSGAEVVRVPCTELARRAGDDRLVALVALGALVGVGRVVGPASVRAALERLLEGSGGEAIARELAAFDAGRAAALAPVVA